MKRIVNLLQIIFVLGKIRPHDDLLSFAPIAFSQKEEWNRFLNKCVLWIVLCQYFPYRVSLLVQILLDFDQKISFNANASSMMGDCPNPPLEFAYRNNSSEDPSLEEKMTIYNFYMLHVDKFVKAFDKSDKFCRVDKDPEEFAALLQQTARFSRGNSITCEDVLGPKPMAAASTSTTAATASASTPAHDSDASSPDDTRRPCLRRVRRSACPALLRLPRRPCLRRVRRPACPALLRSYSLSVTRVGKDPPDTAASSLDDASNSTETSSTTSSDASGISTTSGSGGLTPSPGAGTVSDANRDKTFSLLSYSFNLDPAIRNEVLFIG